jgi:hypothetical protein
VTESRNRKIGLKTLSGAVAAAIVALGLAGTSSASLLVNFKDVPASKTTPELQWTGSSLVAGPGATGNGDGLLPTNLQTEGGLQIEAPYLINDPAHGGIQNIAAGSTSFGDVTLALTGMAAPGGAAGAAMSFGGVVVQPIGAGAFTLTSTNGPAGDLLTGTINDGNVNGLLNSTSGAVFSATVTFTGGEIATAAGAVGQSGTLSFSLLDILPPLGITGAGDTARLSSFGANATGLFSVVPEPASMTLVGLGAVGLGLRRRARRA